MDLVIQARKEKINQLFVSNPKQKTAFINGLDVTIKKLRELGVDEEAIATYCSGLFEGINSQVYNTPIDLFLTSTLGHPNSNNFASNLCSSVKSMMWDTSPFVVLALI